MKAKLKQRYAILTDDDLLFTNSSKKEMFARLQVKLSTTKEELQKIIASI